MHPPSIQNDLDPEQLYQQLSPPLTPPQTCLERTKNCSGKNGKVIGISLYAIAATSLAFGLFTMSHCRHVTCSDAVQDTGESLFIVCLVTLVAARYFMKLNGNWVERRGPAR